MASLLAASLPTLVEKVLSPRSKPIVHVPERNAAPRHAGPSKTASLLNAWSLHRIEKSRLGYAKLEAKQSRALMKQQHQAAVLRVNAGSASHSVLEAQLRERAWKLQQREMLLDTAARDQIQRDREAHKGLLLNHHSAYSKGVNQRKTELDERDASIANFANNFRITGLQHSHFTPRSTPSGERPIIVNLIQQPGIARRIIRLEHSSNLRDLSLNSGCQQEHPDFQCHSSR